MKRGDDTSADAAKGDVARLQDMLRQVPVGSGKAYNGPTSGQYDQKTENAVERYQRHIGLSPTGVANAATLAVLAGQTQAPVG